MNNLNPWEYTDLEYHDQLAYLTVSCTTRCNFRCGYCSKKDYPVTDLDYGLLKKTLAEVLRLGLRKVELTGGEALLYPYFWEVVEYLRQNEIIVQLVTNGSLIDKETAGKLANAGINVALSLSTLDPLKFDGLAGVDGQFRAVTETLTLLKTAGFHADKYPMFAIHSLGSRENFRELDDLRLFAGKNGCGFVLNRAIPVGGLLADNIPSPSDLKTFLDSEFSGEPASVPFSGNTACNRLKAGCYIGSDAKVRPCSAIDIIAGDLHAESITEIWQKSELLNLCRTLAFRLEGSCGSCPERNRCYGCRAAAYAAWGSLTAPDPGCFRFTEDRKFNVQQGKTP